jgi:hypothetical protein
MPRIGSLIHRNNAALDQAEAELAEIAELMPHVDADQCRELRQMTREIKRARWSMRVVRSLLRALDTR